MGAPFRRRPGRTGVMVALVALALAGCGSSRSPSAATTTSSHSTRSTPLTTSTTTTVPATGTKLALGTNNPAEGDCTTNTTEAATTVGYVVLKVTAS